MPKIYKVYKQFLTGGEPYWADGAIWEEVKKNGKSSKDANKVKAEKLKSDAEKKDKDHKYKLKEVDG